MSIKLKYFSVLISFLLTILIPGIALAQADGLERRVENIESYLETLPQSLEEFTKELQGGIQQYTGGLEKSLEGYAQSLQTDLEYRLLSINNKRVELNPASRSFQTIETNSGIFLISIDRMEPIDDGYRIFLNIGNPHYASFKDFKLNLIWGPRWVEGIGSSFEQWQDSLLAAEFSFEGVLERGKWNPARVDLVPATRVDVEYLAAEMTVSSVDLEYR